MNTKENISFTINKKIVKEFHEYAKLNAINKSALIEIFLENYLKDKKLNGK